MRSAAILVLTLACAGASGGGPGGPGTHVDSAHPVARPATGPTVARRLAQYGAAARARTAAAFAAAGIAYPPGEVTLVAIKDEARLEVWARRDGAWAWIADYPVLAASGGAGPKLVEGDGQVPEGVYAIDWLNPQSAYHLSLHVDYPNAFDRAHAAADGRRALGGAIMIHGDAVSIGCLAMGDPAIEELFTLVADTGLWHDPARTRPRVRAVLAPTDLRAHAATPTPDAPPWTAALYATLATELARFPRPPR
ncbi:MAG: L,D-transpeptidase family protein [Myxococcales bacterium]|nr:L,D-transpeptidase family protein [Myxococcales bacterium]